MGSVLTRTTDFWGTLSGPARRLIIGAIVIFAIGVVVLMKFSGTQNWSTVSTTANITESAEITAELQDAGITFRTQDGGIVVQVPSELADDAQLALGAAGLGGGLSRGDDILLETSIGDTKQTTNIKAVIAAERKAAAQIAGLAAVKSARVSIAKPDAELFAAEQDPGSASVVLTLRPGVPFGPEQVSAVQGIVARSVAYVDAENVQVADSSDGSILEPEGSDLVGASAARSRLALQRTHEQFIEADVNSALADTLGPGVAVANANVVLNLDKTTEQKEAFDPESSTPLQTQDLEETLVGEAGAAGAVAGAAGNVGTTIQAPAGGSGTTDYKKTETTTKNGVNKTITTTDRVPGTIERQTIAVQISDKLTPKQIATVETTVKNATGFQEGRDAVSVEAIAFADDAVATEVARAADVAATETAAAAEGLDIMSFAKTGAVAIGVLLLLLVARKSLKRRQGEIERLVPELLQAGPVSVAELGGGPSKQLPGKVKSDIQHQMEDLAKRKPDDVAELVRGWLLDR